MSDQPPQSYGAPPPGWQPQPQVVYVPVVKERDAALPMKIVGICGGAGLIVGSFLPWISAATFVGSIDRGGWDAGDGKLTAAAGALVIAMMFAGQLATNIIALLAAIAGAAITVIDYVDVKDRIDSLAANELGVAEVGVGLYLCGAGAVAGIVGALASMSKSSPGTPPPVWNPNR